MAISRSGRSARPARPDWLTSPSATGDRRLPASLSRWCPASPRRQSCLRARGCAGSRAATTSRSRTEPETSRATRRSSRFLGSGPPPGPPLRRLEALDDVDRLARDLVVAELQDTDAVVRRPIVVPDLQLRDPVVSLPSHLMEFEGGVRGVVAPPLPEALDSVEALPRLGELEHRVLAIHRVRQFGIGTGILEVLAE